MSVGQQLLDVPFPEMVKSMAVGIAEAQYELDLVSLRIAQMMAGNDVLDENGEVFVPAARVKLGDEEFSLLELGFTPSFYQFVDTIIEVKMSISMSRESSQSLATKRSNAKISGKVGFLNASAKASVSSVNAEYAAKYQYSAEGSSLLRTKLVPVPPPTILQERIRALLPEKT